MWTCPKCGRTFKKQNQSHYCGKAPETVDSYIAAQPEEAQQYLEAIRQAIHAALPEAEERFRGVCRLSGENITLSSLPVLKIMPACIRDRRLSRSFANG